MLCHKFWDSWLRVYTLEIRNLSGCTNFNMLSIFIVFEDNELVGMDISSHLVLIIQNTDSNHQIWKTSNLYLRIIIKPVIQSRQGGWSVGLSVWSDYFKRSLRVPSSHQLFQTTLANFNRTYRQMFTKQKIRTARKLVRKWRQVRFKADFHVEWATWNGNQYTVVYSRVRKK